MPRGLRKITRQDQKLDILVILKVVLANPTHGIVEILNAIGEA
jgi:hypothetical protein